MFSLIGRLVILLLIVAPILVRLSIVDSYGLITGFVNLETRAGSSAAATFENLLQHRSNQ
jgi:hypothetical protein